MKRGQVGATQLRPFRIHWRTKRQLEEIRYSLRLASDTEALEVAVLLARDFAKGLGIARDMRTPRQAIMQAADLVGTGQSRHQNAWWRRDTDDGDQAVKVEVK
jgi:hypothetical protein